MLHHSLLRVKNKIYILALKCGMVGRCMDKIMHGDLIAHKE